MTDTNDLLYADTPEGVTYREKGLRQLEAALLAKEDWAAPEEREQTLTKFYAMAAQLRAMDAQIASKARTYGFHPLDESTS